MASPVYHREDLLPGKTGLTFSDSVLVKPRDQDQVESFKEYFKGLEKDVTVTSKVEGTDLYRLRIKDPKHENALDIAEHLAQSPLIKYVGPDWLQLTSAISTTTPNDTYYANQWPIAKIDASNGWDLSTGSSSVVIAILDTGCDLNHEDLSAKYVPIGNRHDVVDNTNTPNDDLGHGTCCAGISAAQSNNNLGFVGVAWNCKIMSIRMLEEGCINSEADIAAAINWTRMHGANVINMSWNWDGTHTNADAALAAAHGSDIVLVAAAGNDDISTINYPASHQMSWQ